MPAISSTFRSGEPALQGLLEDIHLGKIQLPDFQRPWVWDDDHIRDLIASISLWYPIGAVMLLESGGESVRFRPRLVEGVTLSHPVVPERLILDGQQRLTSLYLALRSGKVVPTHTAKGEEIERVYFLDIAACLDPDGDRLEAVVSLPGDRVRRSDFNRRVDLDVSTGEREYELGYFPLEILFDSTRYAAWRRGYNRKFRQDEVRLDRFDEFETQVVQRFQQYRVPVIELLKETPKEAVCQVFEKVNTGGVALTVFELMTATFAADDFRLQEDWQARRERLHKHEPMTGVEGTDFLTAVTLLASYRRHRTSGSAVSCKRRDILRLTLDEYTTCADEIEEGFRDVARFLIREKVFDERSLPYQTQLMPLSVICAVLGDRFEDDTVRRRLARWYWSGVFGELYGGANETRYAFDVAEVVAWIDGGTEPRTVGEANFTPTRLLSLQSRLSAAYKGVMARLMQVGSQDFISGDPVELTSYFDLAVDIHHIFPRSYCERLGLPRQKWNSIVNKAALSARTNRIIGGNSPSSYIATIERTRRIARERFDEILGSHVIEPASLRSDGFDAFIRDRARRLLDLIEQAMGKAVTGRDADEVVAAFGGELVGRPGA